MERERERCKRCKERVLMSFRREVFSSLGGGDD